MKKRLLSALLTLCAVLAIVPAAFAEEASGGISVTVGGKAVEWTDAKPFIDDNNRTMVPLRAVADAMGLKVVWYAAERKAVFTDGGKVLYFPIDSSTATAYGGEDVTMDTAAVIVDGRTYAPIRYLAEFFGYEVGWNGAASTVTITKGNSDGFICGETAPHQWKAANYQAPETCSVCGAAQGSALTPDFVTYGIKADMAVDGHYEYETLRDLYSGAKNVGDLTVLDYNIFSSDATHEAKDGYEWRVATFQIFFPNRHSYTWISNREGYYDIKLSDDSSDTSHPDNKTSITSFTVNYYGEDMEGFYRREVLINGRVEDDASMVTERVSFQVPVGYDGCVAGYSDRAVEWPEGGYIYDVYSPSAFHLFRFA